MGHIKFKLKQKKSNINNKRAYWVEKFLTRLNADRQNTPYPQLKPAWLGITLQFTETDYLGQFYGECENAKNFSSYFWWRMKGGNNLTKNKWTK